MSLHEYFYISIRRSPTIRSKSWCDNSKGLLSPRSPLMSLWDCKDRSTAPSMNISKYFCIIGTTSSAIFISLPPSFWLRIFINASLDNITTITVLCTHVLSKCNNVNSNTLLCMINFWYFGPKDNSGLPETWRCNKVKK